MEQHKTIALRPVSNKVNECLGDIPSGSFNFGLLFNKWFWVDTTKWKCMLSTKHGNSTLPSDSSYLFNSNGWDSSAAEKLLDSKHDDFSRLSESFERIGYKSLTLKYGLHSSLVIGLGNAHPTERGFLFEWNMGIPYIPASSIKGVVRLAAAVNGMNDLTDDDETKIDKYVKSLENDETIPDVIRNLFGSGGDSGATKGKVIFLDAYPASMPLLQSEIMNCHYPDYLNDASKGPTEDQSPVPLKYWAINKMDRSGKPLKFVFRMLLAPEIAASNELKLSLEKAFLAALVDHGLGAKTAVGHGRFNIPMGLQKKLDSKPPSCVLWKGANLIYNAGKKEITARFQNKTATTSDSALVEKTVENKKLRKNKKPVGDVTVEQKGANYFLIVNIE